MTNILNLTDATFDFVVMQATVPVVVEFWSPSCSYCLKMEKVVTALAEQLMDQAMIVRVNILENPIIPEQFSVSGLPAFFYIDDCEIKGHAVGAMSKGRLKEELGIG